MSAPAQDEYDALFNQPDRHARHPADDSPSSPSSSPDDDLDRSSSSPNHHDNNNNNKNTRSGIRQGTHKHTTAEEDDDYDDDIAKPNTHTNTSNMRSRYFLPSLAFDANTGPKGVIADAHSFERAKRSQRFSFFRSKDVVSIPPAYPVPKSGNSSDEEEDDFMARWRQSRLRELQQSERPARSRTASPSKRIYGHLDSVDPDGFLDAIEKVRADTVVVVYIYDDNSPINDTVEDYVKTLAREYATTHFVKLHYEDAEMEGAGVPALVAYRGGEKFADLVPVTGEVAQDQELSLSSLEAALKRHQILF